MITNLTSLRSQRRQRTDQHWDRLATIQHRRDQLSLIARLREALKRRREEREQRRHENPQWLPDSDHRRYVIRQTLQMRRESGHSRNLGLR